jgi:hypothetical protein
MGMRAAPLVVVAWLLAVAGVVAGDTHRAAEPLFAPRVADVRIESVSLDRVDVSMQMVVRARRNVTIRTLRFSDGLIDKIPVWVAPLDGRWPLRRGEEFVIPERIAITAYARDALATASLAELLGRKEVDAHAVVELSFDTPWMARMFGTPINVAVADMSFKAPVPTTPIPQGLAQIGAGLLEALQRQVAPLFTAGPNGQAGNQAVIDRFSRSVAALETDYEIEGGPMPGRRSVKTLGVWWTPSIYCTTREAFEPWRYNTADASQLQIEGARLRESATAMRIRMPAGAAITIDARELRERLPKPADRRVYSLATGEPRRMRLAVRAAPSALLCLRLRDEEGPALPTGAAPAPAAVFAADASRGLVWTEAVANGSMLMLRTPVHRESFGSPLVTGAGVVGLVASPDAAWDADAIAVAAAHALRVTPRRG